MDNSIAGPSNYGVTEDVKSEFILGDPGETTDPTCASVDTSDLNSILDHLKVEEPQSEVGVIKNLVSFVEPTSVDKVVTVKQETQENELVAIKEELITDEEIDFKDLNVENCDPLKICLKDEKDDNIDLAGSSEEPAPDFKDEDFKDETTFSADPLIIDKQHDNEVNSPSSSSMLENLLVGKPSEMANKRNPFFGLNMTAKDVSELPEDLVITLAKYLNYEDILACSAVNINWNQAFNKDSIWRRFRSTFHPEYFNKQTSKTNGLTVNPSKQFCKNKQLVLNERMVGNNWLKGKYTVSSTDMGMLYCDSALDSVDSSGNHWLFLSCSDSRGSQNPLMIQIWNLNNDPVLHSQLSTPWIKNRVFSSSMKFKRGKLFHVTDRHVFVYQFDPPLREFKLLHFINVEVPSEIPQFIFREFATICIDEAPATVVISFSYTSYHILHSIAPFFHVWDENGKLISKNYDEETFLSELRHPSFTIPITSIPQLQLTFNGSNKILVKYHGHTQTASMLRKEHTLAIFDVKNLSFDEFNLTLDHRVMEVDMMNNIIGVVYYPKTHPHEQWISCLDTDTRIIFETKIAYSAQVMGFEFNQLEGNVQLVVVIGPSLEVLLFDVLKQKATTKYIFSRHYHGIGMKIINETMALIQYRNSKTKCVDHIVFSLRDGTPLYSLSNSELKDKRVMSLIFMKHVSYPPKIIAFQDPELSYAISKGGTFKLIVVNFW